MNSFLFNLALILLCASPCAQFCSRAFADYGRFTARPITTTTKACVATATVGMLTAARLLHCDSCTHQDVDLLFGAYVEHMGGFGWFFRSNFFVFVLLGALALAALYLYWFPVASTPFP